MLPKINLLYVITKLELGGAQKHLLDLANNLNIDKYSLFLFTAAEGQLLKDALSINGLKVKRSGFLGRDLNFINDFLVLIQLLRFIKSNNIQIVHTHSSKAGILGRLAAKIAGVQAIVHTVHGWSFNDYQSWWKRSMLISLERFCAKFTDKIIVVSEHDRKKGLDCCIGTPDQYVLIRYGIKCSEFQVVDNSLRKELSISDRDLVVGMIACFKPQKSPLDFVRVANFVKQNFSNVKFLLVGDGLLRNRIWGLIKKLNLKDDIFLIGWSRNIPRVLATMDVFVLTSLWEGLPISVMEAMAAAKPVVATDTGGIAEIIKNNVNGFLVEQKDVKAMGNKILELLHDRQMRIRIGEQSRIDSVFKLESMVAATESIYQSFLTLV